MLKRFFTSFGVVLALAAYAVMSPVPGQAQTAALKKPAAVSGGGAAAARTAKSWVPPRTPWGDPDISGNLNNINESNTPFERPDEFAGKRIEDITPRQRAMLDFAVKVSRRSEEIEDADFEALGAHGFSEGDIWDVGAISAFFALSNRMANMLSLRPNDEFYAMGR